MAKTVDISVVAKEVGLSRTTVSYVLNGKSRQMKIAPQTADRVKSAARELGYVPNYWAKSLVRKRSKLIGVLYPDISGSAAHEITEGIQDVLGQNEYESILAVSFWNPKQEKREIELMLEKRVEGIIALPQVGSEKAYQLAINANCPVVFMCDQLASVAASSVTMDAESAIFKLLSHLRDQRCKRIHMMAVDYKSQTLIEREQAFRKGIVKLGLEYDEDCVSYTRLASEFSIYEKTRLLVEKKNRPDALLCISDAVAMIVLSELARLGVKVPDDIAVASLGNMQFTDHPFFSLTTVDECRKDIGRQAASMLLGQIDKNNFEPEHIRIKGPLITRTSTVGGRNLQI